MRELHVRTRPPIRVFCAFDPCRSAILLIAGHKTDSERFYQSIFRAPMLAAAGPVSRPASARDDWRA